MNVLTPDDAVREGGIKLAPMGPGKVSWAQSWKGREDSLSWDISEGKAAEYEVSVIAQGGQEGSAVQVSVGKQTLMAKAARHWDRLYLGKLRLPAGQHKVTARTLSTPPIRNFYAVEFVTAAAKKKLAAQARKLRAPTDWLATGKYGLMFHWTSETMPRSGPPKSYQDAVRDFDAERFAKMVDDMGGKHVIFTTSHAGFYFPGPNKTIDSILPGRTCERDLVADLIAALNKRGIKLMLYFHPGHDDVPWWTRTHFDDNKTEYFKQWIAIVQEIGERYGQGLAGYFFDDAIFTYYPFNPPWEEMTAAAKAGNPDRLIMYNTWIFPKAGDFYEIFAGEALFDRDIIEGGGYLPVGGTGKFTGGPQQGLQAHINFFLEDDWGHFKRDTPIAPPRFTAEKLIEGLQECIQRKNVVSFDVEIYQDGTVSPLTFELMQKVKKAVRGDSTQK